MAADVRTEVAARREGNRMIVGRPMIVSPMPAARQPPPARPMPLGSL
jgi:hypothetical protein